MTKIDQALVQTHSSLNPKLWDQEDHLLPEVQVALLRIAREFYEFLDFDAPLVDIQVTGSQANYNYTDLSDLDLHLIVPYDQVECDQPVEDLFNTKRKLWKARHDITVHGVPVEAYVEDTEGSRPGAAYSLLKNQWLREPQVKDQPDWDREQVIKDVHIWLERLVSLVERRNLEDLEEFKNQLSAYRKQGLSRDGEYAQENLVYKALRNLGVVSELMLIILALKDQELSI